MRFHFGNNGANTFYGGMFYNWTIYGLGGSDTLGGHNFDDLIFGGNGNDTILGLMATTGFTAQIFTSTTAAARSS